MSPFRSTSILGGVLAAGLAAPAAAQYQNIGPSKCVACHDHDRQATKWQKEEPAQFGAKAHYNTRKQLDAPKAATYAKALGLADPYDLKGSCVQCHSTVFRGDANAGVSCESCHGPASGYNEPHQVKGSYQKAVALGLRDLLQKPNAIAKVCVDCHVTPDRRLAAAGHPAGERFDAGVSLAKLVHWKTAYDYAQVTAAARPLLARRRPGGGGAVAAASAAPAPAAPRPAGPAPVEPAAGKAAPAVAPPAAPAAPPAPWDWDQPVRALPPDYVPEEPPPAPPEPVPPPTRPARPRPPAQLPPSLGEESALPAAPPGLVEPASGRPALAAAAAAGPAPPRSPRADVAALRGRAALVLDRMLRSGVRVPSLPAPARPLEFSGPDGELLRLQDEVLALALEALRRPDPPPAAPQASVSGQVQ